MIDRTTIRRRNDQGIIGWISSTDVMTLGMIMMFALALFIQAKLARGQAELTRLQRLDPDELARKVEELEKSLRARQAELDRMAIEQKKKDQEAAERLRLAQRQLDLAMRRIDELRQALELADRDQKKINREMLGLRGDLKRTAIIIDSSLSMEGKRWDDAVSVMAIWLDKLPVHEAVLIVYNAGSIAVPDDDRSFVRLDGPGGEANRAKLIERLRHTKPDGGTFTRGALERAYNRKGEAIDSIILFTDGAPNTGHESVFVPAEAEKIYKLIGEHQNIPINAIGVGEYFDKDLSEFLLEVGRRSGGTFIGR